MGPNSWMSKWTQTFFLLSNPVEKKYLPGHYTPPPVFPWCEVRWSEVFIQETHSNDMTDTRTTHRDQKRDSLNTHDSQNWKQIWPRVRSPFSHTLSRTAPREHVGRNTAGKPSTEPEYPRHITKKKRRKSGYVQRTSCFRRPRTGFAWFRKVSNQSVNRSVALLVNSPFCSTEGHLGRGKTSPWDPEWEVTRAGGKSRVWGWCAIDS